jgi:hypothetical protein
MSTIEKKSLKVGKYVGNEHVNTVIRNYKKERWVQNSQRLGKPDSLSLWYSVEELEQFLSDIKSQNGDGVRMYFAVYPNETESTKGKDGRQSIVMVATRSKEEENGDLTHKDMYITENGKPVVMAYNMSNYCPPLCAGGLGSGLGVTIVMNEDNGLSVI